MGPIALFDKSFIQSLSVDESVWFDHFFLSTICPLFYVETLADLEKLAKEGHTPEEVVGSIADKFPEMSGYPCAFHVDLAINDLMQNRVPMTGQIPMPDGITKKMDEKEGVVFRLSSEATAFMRWQNRKFMDIERLFAKIWRERLASLDLERMGRGFEALV